MNGAQGAEQNLRILYWNVRSWGGYGGQKYNEDRLARIFNIVNQKNPDIICFSEAMDPALKTRMGEVLPPGYTIYGTSGQNERQQIVILKNSMSYNVTVSQRNEFTGVSGNFRPFPLIEVSSPRQKLAFLSVHTKSGAESKDYYLRRKILGQIANLSKEFNSRSVPLIAMGDFNTMGNDKNITSEKEIEKLKERMVDDMVLLEKDRPKTWMGAYFDTVAKTEYFSYGNFDHVLISKGQEGIIASVNAKGDKVAVGGWPEIATEQDRRKWTRAHSDHAYLVIDVPSFKI